MRTVSISVKRTFELKELKPEYAKKNPKGKFSRTNVGYEVESDLDEAIAHHGKADVYDTWYKQRKLEFQNDLAEQIAKKVLDPEKSSRVSDAMEVEL